MPTNPGDTRTLLRKLNEQGWRVENRRKGLFAYSPDGQTIVAIHHTPSDPRAWRNTIARLRRGGFVDD